MLDDSSFLAGRLVFRLVWAAEAVRVQAAKTGHARSDELGDGPVYALTYGVPSIPAALLCQSDLHRASAQCGSRASYQANSPTWKGCETGFERMMLSSPIQTFGHRPTITCYGRERL